MVKCWDLEANKVIRHYHGHLSGCLARVWDMRTKAQIHVLAGHTATVITGSMDSTIRKDDGDPTHHKKSVRALAIHPTEYSFASGSAGGNNIKKWKCPEGTFVFNFGDNGTLSLWDYDTGIAFQNMEDVPQPGSLEAEAGVFCSTFDVTGTRLSQEAPIRRLRYLISLIFNLDANPSRCAQVYSEQSQ
ncbi:pre-mRNA-splicing factor prp [Salix suchowensis]|nr:pre-mRNA-splicing factor prp [Salix suchowensis]